MAQAKKTTKTSTAKAKTKRGPGRPPKKKEPERPEFLRSEMVIIGTFALAVLLFLSNFRLCGVVGGFLRSLQLGIFGMVGYILPLALFVGVCFYYSNKGNPVAMVKLGALAGAALILCALGEALFGSPFQAGLKLTDFYRSSSATGLGGGLLGGAVSYGLYCLVGKVGTYLILLVLLAVSLVLITERSLVSFVKRGGVKAARYAKEDMDRRKEIWAERQEERKRLREERIVRGVDLDSTKLGGDEEESWDEEEDLAGLTEAIERGGAKKEEPAPEEETRKPEKPENRDDVFTGTIAYPHSSREEEPFDEEELTAVRRAVSGEPEETVYLKKDTRTLKEMNLVEEDFSRSSTEPEEDEVPWDEPSDRGPEPMDGPMAAGKQPQAAGISAAETVPQEEEDDTFEEGFSPAPSKELLSGGSSGEDGFAPAVEEDTFISPEGERRVVTATGKVIETETELLKKRVEKKRAEAAEAGAESGSPESLSAQIAQKEAETVKKEYIFPSLDLLKKPPKSAAFSENEYRETAVKLQQTLRNFGVGVTVTNISCGPSVTRYELHPEQGVKVSKIVGLVDDIKLSLAAADIRIEAPIPGKSAVGIEVPNKENNTVYLREILESESFRKHKSKLAIAVGKDIGGQVVVADIAKMPHLLIAGATGSGKSVCINTLIMSVIYKSSPEDVKLIMVDPKVVELSVYNGIPHLLIPVVTDPKKASGALNWAVAEMMNRYEKFAKFNVRDLKGYNEKVERTKEIDDGNKPKKLPQIIIIIDELADLMMVAPGEVEDAICRLAQLARAAGIHLVIATQRPSVNVITGLIKANVPSRIAFSVSSGVDSRTIIDMNGAEKLLGKGDMLFYPAGYPKPQRVQGAFVSDEEVQRVVDFLSEQGMTTDYSEEIASQIATAATAQAAGGESSRDEYFIQAGRFILEKEKASIGMLQRMFKIGFNRAARIMDQLAEAGVVGEEEGTKPRKILMTREEFEEKFGDGRQS